MRRIAKIALACLLMSGVPAACTADNATDAVRKAVTPILPAGAKIDSIRPTALNGIYEVSYGNSVLYVHANGRYAFSGDMLDLEKRSNISEQSRGKGRLSQMAQVTDAETVVYAPKKVEHTITVFTDIDCGYCRKLHEDMNGYLAQGIKVRYVGFPRAGTESESARKLAAVWCAKNPQDAMNRMMAGKSIEMRSCNNPVTRHYNLGRAIGISGTPAIVLENGDLVPGYVAPDRLRAMLDGK